MDVAERLMIRLENHHALMRMAEDDTCGCAIVIDNAGSVELMSPPLLTEKLLSCADMCNRIAREGSTAGGCSDVYSSMLNAVSTAEKMPAYQYGISKRNERLSGRKTRSYVNLVLTIA